jgi:hypothetical protein
VKNVLLGDNNTQYFQLIANGKHRRKHIFSLVWEVGEIEGQLDRKTLKSILPSFIVRYYQVGVLSLIVSLVT